MSGGPAPSTAEANRLYYADHAGDYDETEHCVAHERVRMLLGGVLDRALARIGTERPAILDACGGNGNASELLARRGLETTLVDVSPQMLAGWRAKAARIGAEAETVEAEIGSFLEADGREWDLIVFSSALHHLDDYVAIVRRAAGHLAPGGALVTAFDPVGTTDPWTQRLRRIDYLLWLALGPRRLAESLARRRASRAGSGVNLGELAERHALEGIDDEAIVAALEGEGLEVAEHERYPCQRYRISDWLLRAGGRATTFHLIALRPGEEAAA